MRSKQQKVRKCIGPLSPVAHIAWLLRVHLSRAAKGEAASRDTGKIPRIQPTPEHCEQLWGREPPPDAPQGRAQPWEPGWQRAGPARGQDTAGPPPQHRLTAVGLTNTLLWHLGPPQSSTQPTRSGTGFWYLPGSSRGLYSHVLM